VEVSSARKVVSEEGAVLLTGTRWTGQKQPVGGEEQVGLLITGSYEVGEEHMDAGRQGALGLASGGDWSTGLRCG
jgi:hypothetical protein